MSRRNQPSTQQQNKQICSVCFTNDPPQKKTPNRIPNQVELKKVLQQLRCTNCKLKVHRYCYDPSITQSKNFKCDPCRYSNNNKRSISKKVCFICNNDFGMLKFIQQNKYAHIQCALTSQQVIFENFKTFKFKINNIKLKQKQKKDRIKCNLCSNGPDAVIKCHGKQCHFYRHIICILKNKQYENKEGKFNDIIFNLLNDTIKSFRVKNDQFIRANQKIFKCMSYIKKPNKNIPLIICDMDNKDYIWCTDCNQVGDNVGIVQCVKCTRWVHNQCSKMQNKSQNSYFECNACMKNHKFLKRAYFPEMIYNMVQFETATKPFNMQNIKYIDCFPFKSSTQLYKIILTNSKQFQQYLLQQHLQKQLLHNDFNSDKISNLLPQKLYELIKQKRFIEIVYYLKYKQIKRLTQISSNQINILRQVYPFNKPNKKNKQEEQNKCKTVFQKLLDNYLAFTKKNQFKQLSIKFVQFSDKIRRQINILKEKQKSTDNIDNNKIKNIYEYQQKLLKQIKCKPTQIALDLRQLFKLITDYKQKFKPSDFIINSNKNIQNKKNNEQNQVKDTNNNNKDNNNNNNKDTNNNQSVENTNQQNQILKNNKKNNKTGNDFLLTLIRCILSVDDKHANQSICVQDLQQLLQFYRKIMFIIYSSSNRPSKQYSLSQQQYYRITNKSFNLSKTILSDQSRVQIIKYFKRLVKQNKIKTPYQTKSQLTTKYDQFIQNDKLNYQQIKIMKENIADQGLFVDKSSKIIILEKRSLYYKALKFKYIKLVKNQLELQKNIHIQTNPIKTNEKNKKDIIENIKRLLQANNKSIKLTQQQKKILQYYIIKQQVFSNILKQQVLLGNKLDSIPILNTNKQLNKIQQESATPNNNKRQLQAHKNSNQMNNKVQIQNDNNINNKRQQNKQIKLSTFDRIDRIFRYWQGNSLCEPSRIISLIYPIAQKNIKFASHQQYSIDNLIDSLCQRYNMSLQIQNSSVNRINSQQFNKLWKLIQYSSLENSYPKIKQLHQDYSQWVYDLQTRFNPIRKVLQDKYKNSLLLEIIDSKIKQAETFQIDLRIQIKKLKVVKLWSILSQKFLKQFQKKPTINAIQQFKGLMLKINYPQNQIYKKVIQLANHGRQLNQRISKYIKKQKYQQMEYYQQLIFINKKMNIKQANQLKNDLQSSKLDVTAQLNQLQQQLFSHSQIPLKNLQSILLKKNNIQQLLSIKKKIIQTPFQYQNLQGYCNIVKRICELKCQNIQNNISKKQFYKLLNNSGIGALRLIQKMPNLLSTYKQIQKAQRQVLSNRPKWQNMLSINDYKRIKHNLSYDNQQRIQIQKIYKNYDNLKQRFRNYKQNKTEYQKYLQLQNQFSHYPINYKQISIQISKMKRDIDILVQRALQIKNNYDPKQASIISGKYKSIPMRHVQLDNLCKMNECYNICSDLAQICSQQYHKYPQFSLKCKQNPILSNTLCLNEIRSQLFDVISKKYLSQQNNQSSIYQNNITISILNSLIYEGSHLCTFLRDKSHIKQRGRLIQKILKLNQKLDELIKINQKKKKNNNSSANNKHRAAPDEQNSYSDDQQIDSNQQDDQQLNQFDQYDQEQYPDQYQSDQYNDDQQSYQDQYEDQDDQQNIMNMYPPIKKAKPQVMQIQDSEQEQPNVNNANQKQSQIIQQNKNKNDSILEENNKDNQQK